MATEKDKAAEATTPEGLLAAANAANVRLTDENDKLLSQISELDLGLGQFKESYEGACETIASMHAAAVGEIRGPIRGVVEDIEDLRSEKISLATEAEDLRKKLADTLHHAPSTLKTAARLLNEAIFSNGSLSANDQAALRPLIVELLAAAE